MAIDFTQRKTVRQGDVFFIPVGTATYLDEQYPERERYGPRIENIEGGIIQRGEATGHDHRLEAADDGIGRRGFLKRVGGMLFVVASGIAGARVVQASSNPSEQEGVDLHRPVDLDPDTTYAVRIAREYDYGRDQQVFVRD